MHGIIHRTIEAFLLDLQGEVCWHTVARAAGVEPFGFRIMHLYPDELTATLLDRAAGWRHQSREELAQDLGGWIAAQPALRRLSRFAAFDFTEFILALPELPDRVESIIPGVGAPRVHATPYSDGWLLKVEPDDAVPGFWSYLLAGFLYGVADDFGALVVITAAPGSVEMLVPATDHRPAQPFALSEGAPP